MPHPGSHIAVVQLLAASTDPLDKSIAELFGGAQTNLLDGGANADAVVRNRYAALGAIGPDLLYFLLDGSKKSMGVQDTIIRAVSVLQAIEDVAGELSKAAEYVTDQVADIPCVGSALATGIDTFVAVFDIADSVLKTTVSLAEGVVINDKGINFFSLLESPRQDARPPKEWYWADHLHYHRTGDFTKNLLNLALFDPKYANKRPLAAYAAGYFTHYVADTIGHPYVNAIVGGPYRLHRQRHTLVENFIDGVVWRESFVSGPLNNQKVNPLTGRAWIDRVRTPATPTNAEKAGFYRSQVHQMIDVGDSAGTLSTSVGNFLANVASKLETVIGKPSAGETLFTTSSIDFTPDDVFESWCDLFVEALHKTYDDTEHPELIRPETKGFLKREDIKAAYVACYSVLRMATTDPIPEPVKPDLSKITKELEEAWEKLKDKAAAAAEKIFSLPHFPSGGSFSFSAAWKSLRDWASKVLDGASELLDAAKDLLLAACDLPGKVARLVTQLAIYAAQLAIRAAYHVVRQMLELRAYAQPTESTVASLPQLWQLSAAQSEGPIITGRPARYPVRERMEDPGLIPPIFGIGMTPYSQDQMLTDLEPAAHPLLDKPAGIEMPAISAVTVHPLKSANALFELFWAQPAPDPQASMFSTKGPATETMDKTNFMQTPGLDFGGIVPNCRTGLRVILENAAKPGASTVTSEKFVLPNYNLDGDRGGAFPTWLLSGGAHRTGQSGPATVAVKLWS